MEEGVGSPPRADCDRSWVKMEGAQTSIGVVCNAGVFLVSKTLLVRSIVVAAIFDFMTVEDWGE